MPGEWKRAVWTYDPVGSAHTSANILNVFKSFLLQCGWEEPPWQNNLSVNPSNDVVKHFIRQDRLTQFHWKYNGDGYDQQCGLQVTFQAPNLIRIKAFLQNSNELGVQRATTSSGDIAITVDNTAPNNYLLVAGEDGLYVEVGRDGDPVNLGHGCVATHEPIVEYRGVRNHTSKWITQGLCMDFKGELRFTENRNERFVANDGSNHNITAGLRPWNVRGSSSLLTQAVVNDPRHYIIPRDTMFGMGISSYYNNPSQIAAFGIPYASLEQQYRISPLYVIHGLGEYSPVYVNNSGPGNSYAASGSYSQVYDYREFRNLRRIGVTDHTILPFTQIQDTVSGKYYRVCRIYDNGRYCNFLVEWPTLAYISVIP